MKKYLFFASAIVLLISAFVALHSFNSVEAQTTGTGTFTIHAQICQTMINGNGMEMTEATCSVTPRDPSAAEASQFSYDIPGTDLSDVKVDKPYSLPVGSYMIDFKSAPENYLYVKKGGVLELPYTFTVSAGQNTEVDIPYVIYQSVEKLGSVGTTIKADIVDGNGNFVRALTKSEIQSVSFDIQFSSITKTGGNVGSFANNFSTIVSSGKLDTSYDLQSYLHGYNAHILTNIKPPSGYVVRSIEPGTYFDPGSAIIGWNLIPSGTSDALTIHFTKTPSPSLTQSADHMLYVPNGISYVKKIAQTYSDEEYKYTTAESELWAVTVGDTQRPFPVNSEVAKFSGVPYLFLNAMGRIIVYNISDPANPKQVNSFDLYNLNSLNPITGIVGSIGGPKSVTAGQCEPASPLGSNADLITSAARIYVLDDVPYILVDIQRPGPGPSGTAVLSIDPSTMTMNAYPQWTHCRPEWNAIKTGTAYGMYKGSDGKIYFVSQPFDDKYYDTVGILTPNSAGVFSQVATLFQDKSQGVGGYSDISDINYLSYNPNAHPLFHSGNKTYLIGIGGNAYLNGAIHIYDISDPKNITKINQGTTISTNAYGLNIDEQAKRMYIRSGISTSTWQVYDLSVLPNAPKLIATYTKATDLLDAAQVNADFAEIAKRLNITSSGNLVDINNYPFSYAEAPSVDLVNVSNNLAYVLLSTNGKTPWDTIANQAGVTDGSEYGTNVIQFIVDLTNATQPKILGMIFGHTEYPADVVDGFFDFPIYGSIFDYNGYIYRSNYHIADVWKLGNPSTQSTGATSGGTGSSNTSISTTTIQNLQQTLFSFQNLLNIFKRIYAK